MQSEWPTRRIGSLGRVVTGKTPSTAKPENFGGPYPFITIPDLNGRVLIETTERTLSQTGADSMRSAMLPAGAVMMSCIATIGKCAITSKPSFTNQQINSVICNDEVDSKFLYYCFTQLSEEVNASGGGGSVYTNVSKSRFSNIEINLPPLPEQKAIARVLGSLDDKIELNRRMNATLEQMAQTLFRAWFVDFEPVKAKAAGLKPVGMDAETAALFPSEFESSTLGLIPKGWSIGTLAQVCEARRETVQPSAVDTEFPYVGLEHIPQKSIALESWGNAAQVDSTKARFKSGDILFGKLRPYFHKVVVAPIDGICSTDILVLKPTESLNLGFVLCHASSIELIEYATRLSNGARMPRVGWKDIGAYPVVVPPPKILGIFTPLVQHMVSRIHNNIQESQTLSQIRDALLPRLISGQLRVPDVVNSVEPVLKRES